MDRVRKLFRRQWLLILNGVGPPRLAPRIYLLYREQTKDEGAVCRHRRQKRWDFRCGCKMATALEAVGAQSSNRFSTQSGSSWRTIIPSAVIRAWKTDFRSPDPSLPYPIILFNADSASEECSATTIVPQPDE
jgi:hypothetical protein